MRNVMKATCSILFVGCLILSARATETNLYHHKRYFEPVSFTNMGTPTFYKVIMAANELTGIVGYTNIVVDTNQTYAKEYEGVSWGYSGAYSAWTNAFNCHTQHLIATYPAVWYDNAGWVKGTEEVYDQWGGYVWFLQNTIAFDSSPTNEYVSAAGVTSLIARVLVGSLGDYCPQTSATEVSPALNTDYPGEDTGTNAIFRADTRAFYKLVTPLYTDTNDGDADGDGIPDYADGFDWDDSQSDDDQTAGDLFEPWQLSLPLYVDISQTELRFDYSASNPTGLVRSGSVSNYTYTPASGTLRLWTDRADKERDKAEVSSGGDYIGPTNYTASAIGFSSTGRTVTLYVEGIAPSLDQSISVQFSTNGTNWVCLDGVDSSSPKMQITNIKFNHDTGSSSNDALNIRVDYTNSYNITNGEWIINSSTNWPVAYTTNKSISIKVRLSAEPSTFTGSADIWAESVNTNGSLGDVLKTSVDFVNGVSNPEYITFQVEGITPTCIQKTTNDVWLWKMENLNETGSQTWVLNTSGVHTVYTILNEPVAPWDNAEDSASNAWVSVMNIVCSDTPWAGGTETITGAASRVTKAIYNSGRFEYDETGGGGANYTSFGISSVEFFDLSAWINRLSGGVGLGPEVNCWDCANGVVSMCNILGCDLWNQWMGSSFTCNEIRSITDNTWAPPFPPNNGFSYHRVGWRGAVTNSSKVFDACLKVDDDGDPTGTGNHNSELIPTDIVFWTGSGLFDDYKQMLVNTNSYASCVISSSPGGFQNPGCRRDDIQ